MNTATIHTCRTCFYPMQWSDGLSMWGHAVPGVYFHHAEPLSVCPRCEHAVGHIVDGRCVHPGDPFSVIDLDLCGCDWQIPAPDPAARQRWNTATL